MFAERRAKLFEVLIEMFQRSELIHDLTKLVLENVHRLEHMGQIDYPQLELTERLKHLCEIAEPLHRFAKRRDANELRLQRLDLIKNRRDCQSCLKTGILAARLKAARTGRL